MLHSIESQLSISLENQPGQIARICDLMSEHGINIGAVSMIDGSESGVFRFTTDLTDRAASVLRSERIDFQREDVLSIKLNDSKGKLADLTKALARASINVDYVYATVDEEGGSSRLIVKVSNIPLATRVLEEIAPAA